jgi:hypothetical protein
MNTFLAPIEKPQGLMRWSSIARALFLVMQNGQRSTM